MATINLLRTILPKAYPHILNSTQILKGVEQGVEQTGKYLWSKGRLKHLMDTGLTKAQALEQMTVEYKNLKIQEK